MIFIVLVMTLAVFVITVLSCISDVRSLRIPNWHSLAIAGCFIPAFAASPEAFHGVWQHIGAMGIMFIVSYAMFAVGMMGGGDSKLATALALWAGLKGLAPFLLFMAIAGGVIGGVSLVIQKKKFFKKPIKGSWVEQAQKGRSAIPYGVAISFGAWISFFHTGFIHHQLNEVLTIIH
jgi:prepilin peptidase CpaA